MVAFNNSGKLCLIHGDFLSSYWLYGDKSSYHASVGYSYRCCWDEHTFWSEYYSKERFLISYSAIYHPSKYKCTIHGGVYAMHCTLVFCSDNIWCCMNRLWGATCRNVCEQCYITAVGHKKTIVHQNAYYLCNV